MKNINMKNNDLCFAHFRPTCKCHEGKNVRLTFSELVEGGNPMCADCGNLDEFLGVEIVKPVKKPSKLKIRMGSESLDKGDRPVNEYEFSTPADRSEALELLNDYDGYLNYEVLVPR